MHVYDGPLGDVVGYVVRGLGARTPEAYASSATSTTGTAAPTRCARSGSSGVWELFVPDVGDGTRYKFEVLGADGVRRLKSDPMAQATEMPPATASRVFTSTYVWGDDDWMQHRARQPTRTTGR